MPLYELILIASHHAQLAPLRALTTTTSSLILANGGVVRSLDYWGTRHLPQKMIRGDGASLTGDYYTMRFDANPPTITALNDRLRLDPRVLRWTTLKIGTTLDQITAPATDPTIKFARKLPEELMAENGGGEASGSGFERRELPGGY